MIIWGSTGKTKRIDTPEFFCPGCRDYAEGSHMRVSQYFTLYFIPLFPMETLGEFIRCDECGGEFDTSVLELTRKDFEAAQKPWKCGGCSNSNPSEYEKCLSCGARRFEEDADDLVDDEDDIKPVKRKKSASSAAMKDCPYCGEEIRAVAVVCRFCGESLED